MAPMEATAVLFPERFWRRVAEFLPFSRNKGAGEVSSRSICSAFAAVASRFASAPALVCDGVQISYADLDRVSTRISAQLRHAGLRRGQVVGLVARRSIEATAAILGILKAGGAYLPLDISYPPELLRYICNDSRLSLTLVEQALSGNAEISNFWSGATRYISLSDGLIGPSDDCAPAGERRGAGRRRGGEPAICGR